MIFVPIARLLQPTWPDYTIDDGYTGGAVIQLSQLSDDPRL